MQEFKRNPILNSPYAAPKRHWELDERGIPNGDIVKERRRSTYLMPIPKPRATRGKLDTAEFEEMADVATTENTLVNEIRQQIDKWRILPQNNWQVTEVTRRLLAQWRDDQQTRRPFFCQIEAAETLIWLNEVAPKTAEGKKILGKIKDANHDLMRVAIKMATGAGKTTVMAMMIAYHTINAKRTPNSPLFTRDFLIITPGITIRDRLRVLIPSDPQSMYAGSGIVPPEYGQDMSSANVVITNYHAFQLRETIDVSKPARQILQGHEAEPLSSRESEGQMLRRVCGLLISEKKLVRDVVVINDEAHHCYRHRDDTEDAKPKLSGEEKEEIKANDEAARLWISGIEALNRQLARKRKQTRVYDLSATPFFLSGSGYTEGSLFPWVVSDFALFDAIECGIVKLPRVPVDDNTIGANGMPMYRDIYSKISRALPKKGRNKKDVLDPQDLPTELQGALQALYSHYKETFEAWQAQGLEIPPVFIIVCNNTATSKVVYDYVAGYEVQEGNWRQGKLPYFSNVGSDSQPLHKMNTLLIDSKQLESGDALSKEFKDISVAAIDLFKSEVRHRFPERDVSKITEQDLLREVMNTVGKPGRLGSGIRCVVSVSMLTEGWDANNVTHILGIRKFGTQLLCEQVVGRALRRYSYDIITDAGESEGHFPAEYADIFGVPFNFASGGTPIEPPKPPKPRTHVHAVAERAQLQLEFPLLRDYTFEPPQARIQWTFTEDSHLTLTPEIAASRTTQSGIVGESTEVELDTVKNMRMQEIEFFLTSKLVEKFGSESDLARAGRFVELLPIVRAWMAECLHCSPGTFVQYLHFPEVANQAAEKIFRACVAGTVSATDEAVVVPLIDGLNSTGSSAGVNFLTSRETFPTAATKCHINHAVLDSGWEDDLCKLLESYAAVAAYARTDGMGFTIPYEFAKKNHHYRPDFLARIDNGTDPPFTLIIEVKGARDEKDAAKADTVQKLWLPAVNNDGRWGVWKFVEITSMYMARAKLSAFFAGNLTESQPLELMEASGQ